MFGYCTTVYGAVHNFTRNFVFGPEYSVIPLVARLFKVWAEIPAAIGLF